MYLNYQQSAKMGGLIHILVFSYIFAIMFFTYARIAQLVEHSTDTRKVLGSTPSARTKYKKSQIMKSEIFCILWRKHLLGGRCA
jgi:hypothetical protein